MDFSNVVVQDAGDVLDDVDSVAFTSSDGTSVVPMSPRADPQIWLDVSSNSACQAVLHPCGFVSNSPDHLHV